MGQIAFSTQLKWILQRSCQKFIPRKGNMGLMHASTPELAEPSCEDVVEGQDGGSRMKAAGQYQLPVCFPIQVQPVGTTRSSGGE